MLTLDEVIKGEYGIVDACKEQANMSDLDDPYARNVAYENDKCAERHKQIAEWLKELKKLKEQEPCEDAISRVETVKFLEDHSNDFEDAKVRMAFKSASSLVNNPHNLPTVKSVVCIGTVKFSKEDMQELVDDAVKELKTMTDDRAVCEDCVERENLIDKLEIIYKKYDSNFYWFYWDVRKMIESLPTVRTTQRKGKWITKFHGFPAEPTLVCSECGFDRDFNINTRGFGKIKYCPNCGTKMEEK